MSLATMGKVDNHPGFGYIAMATAERVGLHNSFFDGARGASSSVWRGSDAARPMRAARNSSHLSSRSRSSLQSGSRLQMEDSLRLTGRPSIRGASRGLRRSGSRRGNAAGSATSLAKVEARSRPTTASSMASRPTRPNTAGSAESGALSLGSGSVRGWFGSRPASREGVLEREERRARAKSRPRNAYGPRRNARGAFVPAEGAYPQRADPWEKYLVTRTYEKAAEEERAASAWSDPELQQWLAAKEAQSRLRVGTWAAECTRLDGRVETVTNGNVPLAPLNRWNPRKEARLAEQRLGFDVNESATDAVLRNSQRLPDLTSKRQVAARMWQDAHHPPANPRAQAYADHEEFELSTSTYYDPVCGYRRGGADGSYSFAIATGIKSDLPAKRARAAALWKAYEDAYEPVDAADEGPVRKNFSAIYATDEEAEATKRMSEWMAAKRTEYERATTEEGAEPIPGFDEVAAAAEYEALLAAERATAQAASAAADDEEVLLRECLRAICQAVDTVHTDEWRRENDPAYTLGLEGTQEEEEAAARMQAIQRGRMERKRQLAAKKGQAIFGPLRFHLLISKFQAMWRGKMQRRQVKKKTLTMQMKEAGDRDWSREIGVLESEPQSESGSGAEAAASASTPAETEQAQTKEPSGNAEQVQESTRSASVEAAQKALDIALAEQVKAKNALEKPPKPLKKKAKNAAREALAEVDKRVADAQRKLRVEEQKAEAKLTEEPPAPPAPTIDYKWLVNECTAVLQRGGASTHGGGATDAPAATALAKTLQKMLGGDLDDAALQRELFELLDDPAALDTLIPELMANRRRVAYLQ